MLPKVKTEVGKGISLKDKNKLIRLHNGDYSENMKIKFIFSYAFYTKLITVNALKAC